MMLYTKLILLISILFFSTATYAAEPEHDDKAHEKAEKNLDDKHWNVGHRQTPPGELGSPLYLHLHLYLYLHLQNIITLLIN